MKIKTNVSALNAHRNLSDTQRAASDSMAKLSSGFRINRASDDAAGLGIANQMRATTRALTQVSRNAEQANSMLQIAEGSTAGIQKMLERMKELATQAGSDTVDDDSRGRIQKEVDALAEEIQRTVDTTVFAGTKLLGGTGGAGSAGSFTFLIGSSADYAGQDKIDVTIADLSAATLTVDALDVSTVDSARTALTNIDTAISSVNEQLGDLGAYQNRIENAQSNLKTAIQNFSAAESVIRDLDMAEEMTKFSKNNILSQAGTAMLARAASACRTRRTTPALRWPGTAR
ncbi:MAG: flagellin [Gemmatimonadetes bacterium]|nr:flagellin [Gemmatimonadota bacterium]